MKTKSLVRKAFLRRLLGSSTFVRAFRIDRKPGVVEIVLLVRPWLLLRLGLQSQSQSRILWLRTGGKKSFVSGVGPSFGAADLVVERTQRSRN
jgi:hypothetical protein